MNRTKPKQIVTRVSEEEPAQINIHCMKTQPIIQKRLFLTQKLW